MKMIRNSKSSFSIKFLFLILIFVACRKENNVPLPKVSVGPDLDLKTPTREVELDATETFKQNPAGIPLWVEWKVISQPAGSPNISLDPPHYLRAEALKTKVSGLEDGVYIFQLNANFKNGSVASEFLEVRVWPDPVNGSFLSFVSVFLNDNGWDNNAYTTINDSIAFSRQGNIIDKEVLVWDYVKKNWLNPNDYELNVYNIGELTINTNNEDYYYLRGRKVWILVKAF